MTELEQLIAEAEPLRISDPDEKLGAIVDRINAIRNGAPMAMPAVVEGADAVYKPSGPDKLPNEEDERAILIASAKDRGIKVDKRWGIDRLREALNG